MLAMLVPRALKQWRDQAFPERSSAAFDQRMTSHTTFRISTSSASELSYDTPDKSLVRM